MSVYRPTQGDRRTEELNKRVYQRNIPSAELQAQFSPRPVNTKYGFLPILDQRMPSQTAITVQPLYSVGAVFNPGSDQGPWSGYASHVNDESKLRNQFFGLQTAAQARYIPSSRSDLYQLPEFSSPEVAMREQPFPGLFDSLPPTEFNPNPNPAVVGTRLFDNCTRQQIKDGPAFC